MDMESTSALDAVTERLVPLDTWLYENARARSVWRSGSPRVTGPDGMAKWLKRHDAPDIARRGNAAGKCLANHRAALPAGAV